jgi:hypothetical protein
MAEIIATWDISLNCDCPKCNEYVDLLDYPDFWEGHSRIDIPEHGTENSRDVKVQCPKCDHRFTVDLEY